MIFHVLTTNFHDHWREGKTSYFLKMIKSKTLKNNSKVYLIKIKKEDPFQIESFYEANFTIDEIKNQKQYFKVNKLIPLSVDEFDIPKKYLTSALYDYANDIIHKNQKQYLPIQSNLDITNIYKNLQQTTDFRYFENTIDTYLRLMGVPYLYKIQPYDSRGKADGFFQIEKTFVIYDATLDLDFSKKEIQIENYKNQILKDEIIVKSKTPNTPQKTISLKNLKKEIWIINKKINNHIHIFEQSSQKINVRYVSLDFLYECIVQKIDENLNLDEFEKLLFPS
jgi:hypothetical protein